MDAFSPQINRQSGVTYLTAKCRSCLRRGRRAGGRRLSGGIVQTRSGTWQVSKQKGDGHVYRNFKTESEAQAAAAALVAQYEFEDQVDRLVLPEGTRFYINEEARLLDSHPSSYPAVARWDFTFALPALRFVMLWMVGDGVAAVLFDAAPDRRVEAMGLLALEGQDDHFSRDEDGAVFGDQTFERLLVGPLRPAMWALYHLASGTATAVLDSVPGSRAGAVNALGDASYTLTLAPLRPRRPSQKRGGHRDLREHGVRGHLREISPGKRVAVRAHKRGNAAKGVITKDYEVAIP